MEWLVRIIVFVLPVLLTHLFQVLVVAGRGGPELELFKANPIEHILDMSIDFLLSSTAILLALLLYSNSNILKKPGTDIPIQPKHLIACCGAQIVALGLILFSSVAVPRVFGYESEWLTIFLPDVLGFSALILSMVVLA